MAVFTPVTDDGIEKFISQYDVGSFIRAEPIAAGVENTNYKIVTTQGMYVLTIVEYRTETSALPFIVDYQKMLQNNGITCSSPLANRHQQTIGILLNKPALLAPFLNGRDVTIQDVTPDICGQIGNLLARMHVVGSTHQMVRENPMGLQRWMAQSNRLGSRLDELADNLAHDIALLIGGFETHIDHLPQGSVHADLFVDNVFFENGKIAAVIDFYFSCRVPLVYDFAITANAWMFDEQHRFIPERWQRFVQEYQKIRPLNDREIYAFPALRQIAAMRFLLSGAEDWFFRPDHAVVIPKDPHEYVIKLKANYDWFG